MAKSRGWLGGIQIPVFGFAGAVFEPDIDSVSYVLLKALHGEETANFKLPLVKNGKQNAILLLNATTRRGPDGEATGVIGVGQAMS